MSLHEFGGLSSRIVPIPCQSGELLSVRTAFLALAKPLGGGVWAHSGKDILGVGRRLRGCRGLGTRRRLRKNKKKDLIHTKYC